MNQSIDTIETAKINFKNGLELIKKMETKIEMWKPIEGYDNYGVSSFGRIKNNRTDKILKCGTNSRGYDYILLRIKGKAKSLVVHKLVCQAFYKNPLGKPYVDHIDNNPKNNHMHNLRFATDSENKMNKSKHGNNTSGTTGVTYTKTRKKHILR